MLESIVNASWDNKGISFRSDTDLGFIAQSIRDNITFQIPPDLDNEEKEQAIVLAMDKFLESDRGTPVLEAIKDYGLQMASKFQNAFETLQRTVAPEVASLSEKIQALRDEMITKRTGYANLDGDPVPVEPVFQFFDPKINYTKYAADTNYLFKKYLANSGDSISLYTLKSICGNIPSIQDISLSTETINDFVSSIRSELYSNLSEDQILKADKVIYQAIMPLFRQTAFTQLNNQLFGNSFFQGKITEQAVINIQSFLELEPIYEKATLLAQFDNQSLDTFNKNMDIIKDTLLLAYLSLYFAADSYNRNSQILIVGPTMLNKSVYDKFAEQGGTIKDIVNYLRMNCNSNKEDMFYTFTAHSAIPETGISMNQVLNNIDSVNSRLDKLQNDAQTKLQAIKAIATKDAFETTIRQYLSNVEVHASTMVPSDPYRFFLTAKSNMSVAQQNLTRYEYNNIYDSVYSFYLNTWYPNTLVSTIYYKLGVEVVKLADAGKDFDNDSQSFINLSVMADVLSAYIGKTMVVQA